MRRRYFLETCAAAAIGASCKPAAPPARNVPALPWGRPGVYVWQRAWSAEVGGAVRASGRDFDNLCWLAAERESNGAWTAVPPDWQALRESGTQLSPGLRVGVPSQPLPTLAGEILTKVRRIETQSKSAAVPLAEWQLDLDCPLSRLEEYRGLMRILSMDDPARWWSFTALPDWLQNPAFAGLAAITGRFVLQVHALKLPAPDETSGLMCDPARARQWVARAGKIGVPFRVALPTYASRVFFDSTNRVLDVAGEDGAEDGPSGTVRQVLVRSDAAALAPLMADWLRHPPAACTGVIWYRLPVPGDRWNWKIEGLREVTAGRVPASHITVTALPDPAGFYRIEATAHGPVEARLPTRIEVSGPSGSRVLAFDFHGNWQGQKSGDLLVFQSPGGWLYPGRSQRPGWIRWSRPGTPVISVIP